MGGVFINNKNWEPKTGSLFSAIKHGKESLC